jgi:hypothetical protein
MPRQPRAESQEVPERSPKTRSCRLKLSPRDRNLSDERQSSRLRNCMERIDRRVLSLVTQRVACRPIR